MYLRFLADNRKEYLNFSKQLFAGEMAGFVAGIAVAELMVQGIMISDNNINNSNFMVSIFSSAADYLVSLTGFFIIFYLDNKSLYCKENKNNNNKNSSTSYSVRKIFGKALILWPSVAIADIAFIITRPYFQYVFLQTNIEPGVSAVLAHFIAFATFNIVAMLSRSLIEFEKTRVHQM